MIFFVKNGGGELFSAIPTLLSHGIRSSSLLLCWIGPVVGYPDDIEKKWRSIPKHGFLSWFRLAWQQVRQGDGRDGPPDVFQQSPRSVRARSWSGGVTCDAVPNDVTELSVFRNTGSLRTNYRTQANILAILHHHFYVVSAPTYKQLQLQDIARNLHERIFFRKPVTYPTRYTYSIK